MTDTSPKPFVFVLMPFQERFDDVYELGIKGACDTSGTYCERVDKQIFHENILSRIFNQIAKADLVVADMMGQNPNVFYEVEYTHGINKKVILLTQDESDIPFDMKHYPHVTYRDKNITKLRSDLEQRISFFLYQPDESVVDTKDLLAYYIRGQKITERTTIRIEPEIARADEESEFIAVTINFTLNNTTNRVIDISKLRFTLVIPAGFTMNSEDFIRTVIRLPDNNVLIKLGKFNELFGKECESNSLFLSYRKKNLSAVHPSILKIYSRTGLDEIRFNLNILPMLGTFM